LILLFIVYKYLTYGSSNIFKGYKPSFPFAYIYGMKKPFMFHTEEMLQYLTTKENCEVHKLDVGHFVMDNNEKMINEVISRRLKALNERENKKEMTIENVNTDTKEEGEENEQIHKFEKKSSIAPRTKIPVGKTNTKHVVREHNNI